MASDMTAPVALGPLADTALFRPGADGTVRIERAEMLRYLGYSGQRYDEELDGRIEHAAAELERDIAPRGVRRAFPVDAGGCDADGNPCIRLTGTTVELRGRDIFRHLKDACACAVIACTLGMESERRLRTLSGQHPLDALLLDAAASAYVESAVRTMEDEVRRDAKACGLTCNWRFSCGYGDCPLEVQDALVSCLNARRLIGLTTTPGHLLVPSKSVTALIGLFQGAPHAADERPTCGTCRLRGSCSFRERNTTCHP